MLSRSEVIMMTAQEFKKKIENVMCKKLSSEEWLKLDEEAHKMDVSEFDIFRNDPIGVMFGDRINLIKDMKKEKIL